MRTLLAACAALALTACGQTTNTTETPVSAETPAGPQTREEANAADTCGARAYASMIGTNIAAIQMPANANVRIIQPDTPVTQDFRTDRLNIIVDANGAITALECY